MELTCNRDLSATLWRRNWAAGSCPRRGQPLGAEVLLVVLTAGRKRIRVKLCLRLLARARALSTLPRPTQTSVTVTGLKRHEERTDRTTILKAVYFVSPGRRRQPGCPGAAHVAAHEHLSAPTRARPLRLACGGRYDVSPSWGVARQTVLVRLCFPSRQYAALMGSPILILFACSGLNRSFCNRGMSWW